MMISSPQCCVTLAYQSKALWLGEKISKAARKIPSFSSTREGESLESLSYLFFLLQRQEVELGNCGWAACSRVPRVGRPVHDARLHLDNAHL